MSRCILWVIVDSLTKSEHFPSCADDFHTGGIMLVVDTRDRSTTWSVNVHCLG